MHKMKMIIFFLNDAKLCKCLNENGCEAINQLKIKLGAQILGYNNTM